MSLWSARADWWKALQWWKDDEHAEGDRAGAGAAAATAAPPASSSPSLSAEAAAAAAGASSSSSKLSLSFSRGRAPSVSSPFNVRRVSYLDVNLRWHGEGGELSAMLELGRQIGRGGFSDVYQARHIQTGVMYACKVFRHIPFPFPSPSSSSPSTASQPQPPSQLTSLIQREMDVLRRLRHDHIVSYFGCLASPDSDHLALMMELCDGGSVKDLLQQSAEKLRERHIAYVLRCTLLALHYLHSHQLVHRDLKAANILLTTNQQIKLGDFGISASRRLAGAMQQQQQREERHRQNTQTEPDTTEASATSTTYCASSSASAAAAVSPDESSSSSSSSSSWSPPSGPLGGTPLWMSPECLQGAEPDFSGDVWSLGITCIEIAQGQPPHARLTSIDDIRAVVISCPSPSLALHAPSFPSPSAAFASFVDACLIKDPRQRATVAQLLSHPFITQVVNEAAGGAPTLPSRATHLSLPLSPRPRSKSPSSLAAPPPLSPVPPASPSAGLSAEQLQLSAPPTRRSVSCPSPRSPISPCPPSHSYSDPDFRHFILFGCYPATETAEVLPSPSPSPQPPSSPSLHSLTSSIMDRLARAKTPRRLSVPSMQQQQQLSPSPSPTAPPPPRPLRGSRQLSVPVRGEHSLSPSPRSPSKTPLAAASPAAGSFAYLPAVEHSPPVLVLPSLQSRSRRQHAQAEDKAMMAGEQKEAPSLPSAPAGNDDGEGSAADPSTTFRLVVNDHHGFAQPAPLRRAQSLDYGKAREISAIAKAALKPLRFSLGLNAISTAAPAPSRASTGSFLTVAAKQPAGTAELPIISLDLTPLQLDQGGEEKSDESGDDDHSRSRPASARRDGNSRAAAAQQASKDSDDQQQQHSSPDTPRASQVSRFAPSPSTRRSSFIRSLSTSAARARHRESFFDFVQTAEPLAAAADGGDEGDEDAVVVDNLDLAFADIPKAAAAAPSHHFPPLVPFAALWSASSSTVQELCASENLPPMSPSPLSAWDAHKAEQDAHTPSARRQQPLFQPLLATTVSAQSLASSFPVVPPLRTAASSPQLVTSSQLPWLSLSAESGDAVAPVRLFPSPAVSALVSPTAQSPHATPRVSPTAASARRPAVSLLRLPGIADDEPQADRVSLAVALPTTPSRAAPLSTRASGRRLSIQLPAPPEEAAKAEPSHDSFIISEHGTLITTEFRISASGVFSNPSSEAPSPTRMQRSHSTVTTSSSSCSSSFPSSPDGSALLFSQQLSASSSRLATPQHVRSVSTPSTGMNGSSFSVLPLSPLMSPAASASSAAAPPAFELSSPLVSSFRRPSAVEPSAAAPLSLMLRAEDLVEMGDIGTGQHGSVRKALHLPSLTRVALKTINVFDRDSRHQLLKELRTYSRLRCDQLVGFLGAYHRDGQTILASEYCDCGSLKQFVQMNGSQLQQRTSPASPPPSSSSLIGLPEPLLRHLTLQLVLGLQYLHGAHVVHRDIKPDNLLCSHSLRCQIGDFGLTTELENSRASISAFSGTLAYLSPERVSPNQSHSFPADIWSLGVVVAYAAACSRREEIGEAAAGRGGAAAAGGVSAQQSEGVDLFAIMKKKAEVEELHRQAADRPDDAVHSVFPAPPCTSTALLPPDVSAEYHSAELLSFLAACLQIAPHQRWTATQLLSHPFLLPVSSSLSSSGLPPPPPSFALPAGFHQSSLTDLHHICRILCERYRLCTQQHADADECSCRLTLDDERLSCLSQQLLLPREQIQAAFRKAQDEHKRRKRAERQQQQRHAT